MHEPVFLGFDFGMKRIGVAVGQRLTSCATPLQTLHAMQGVPDWSRVAALIKQWKPQALVVGLPTCLDGTELYVTEPSREFARVLGERFDRSVHLVDERLTTVDVRSVVFAAGGYRKLKGANVDSLAACVILEQWLRTDGAVVDAQ